MVKYTETVKMLSHFTETRRVIFKMSDDRSPARRRAADCSMRMLHGTKIRAEWTTAGTYRGATSQRPWPWWLSGRPLSDG